MKLLLGPQGVEDDM